MALCPGSISLPTMSPMTANVKTIRPNKSPGNIATHHCPVINELGAALAIIAPSSGVGGLTPAPTNLSPAVNSTAKPIVTDT